MNHVSERHLHLHLLLKMEPAKSRQSRCRTSAARHENCRQIRQTDMDAFRKRRIPDNFDQETRTTNCTKSATEFSQQQTQSKSNCSYSQILDRRISPARTAQLSTHFHHQCSSPHRHPLSTLSLILLIITLLFSHSLLVSTAAHAASSSSAKKTSLRQQRFEMEPIDKTAIVGDTVILPCRVENKVGTLQWTRDGFGLGTERTLEGFQRYRMVGNDDEGDYSLEISNVALEDDAVFQCQVGALDSVHGIRSRSASFTVQVPPEAPVIVVTHAHSHAQVVQSSSGAAGSAANSGLVMTQGTPTQGNASNSGEMLVSAGSGASLTSSSSPSNLDHHLRTTAGMTIELTCEAHGGRPPAELTWMDSTGNAITNGVAYSTTKLSDGKRWNAALKWTVVASRALDGQRVTCRSENAALKGPRFAAIQLEVRYAPEVELRISSSSSSSSENGGGYVRQGDDLTLECIAAGNPSRMTFKWSRDGVPLGAEGDVGASGDGTPRLVFRRVGREFHGTVIACEVANSVGSSRAKIEVKVAFQPRFLKTPEPVVGIGRRGESVKLECAIDAYPKAAITWSKFVPRMVVSSSSSSSDSDDDHQQRTMAATFTEHWQELEGETSPTLEVDSAGRYRCIGKSAVFDEELRGETLVFIKGAPLIRSPSVQYGIENEPVRLQCMVEAIPPPTKITWFKLKPFQQILGVDNNEGYEILEEEDPDDYSMPLSSSSSSSSSSAGASSSSSSLSSSSSSSASYLTSPAQQAPFSASSSSDQPLSSLALLRSIIYIRRAKESDFGQYNCSVWNQYGFQSQIITLQQQANILSPLVLTLSGIIGTGVLFVLVASLVVFACIRSQRLRSEHSLAPKKLENSENGLRGPGVGCNGSAMLNGGGMGMGMGIGNGIGAGSGSGSDGTVDDLEKKMNTLNSLEKSLVMKNTIMKVNHHGGSNQVLATVLAPPGTAEQHPHHHPHHLANYMGNSGLPVYSEYEYNYTTAYPPVGHQNPLQNGDLVIANGVALNNNNNNNSLHHHHHQLPPNYHSYDNMAAYNGGNNANHHHYDYALHDSLMTVDDKNVQLNSYGTAETTGNGTAAVHLYSTVMKNPQQKAQLLNSTSTNYTSLLSTTTTTNSGGGNNPKLINVSSSQPISISTNTNGLPSPGGQTFGNANSNTLTSFSSTTSNGGLKTKDSQASFGVNPYMRTSNQNGLPSMMMNNGGASHHYSNVVHDGLQSSAAAANANHDHRAALSAGVYNASALTNRYKTNSLGGGSSSSGVVSTGTGSCASPGHSPVGSVSATTAAVANGQVSGTHV